MRRATRYMFAAFVLGVICTISIAIRVVGNRVACSTEERFKTVDPSGITFEVEDTCCDTLAKDEHIRLYATKVTPKGAWGFWGLRNRRTLLIEYDPGRFDNPLPSINHPSQTTILISIPEVSSIVYQNRKWENMSVNYEIGRVDYPSATK